jgi:hypothetical protein
VLAELGQAVLVHVVQTVVDRQQRISRIRVPLYPSSKPVEEVAGLDLHARSTSCDLPSLPQAVQLSSAVRLGLALHVIIVVGLTPGSNEEAGAEEWC